MENSLHVRHYDKLFIYNSHGDSSQLTKIGMINLSTSQMKKQGQREEVHHSRLAALKVHSRCTTQSQVCLIPRSIVQSHYVALLSCESAELSLNPHSSMLGRVSLSK